MLLKDLIINVTNKYEGNSELSWKVKNIYYLYL